MKTIKYFGAFGEVRLSHIEFGIAYFGKDYLVDAGNGDGSRTLKVPEPCWDWLECNDIAAQRGHVVAGWVSCEFGGDYYAVEVQE